MTKHMQIVIAILSSENCDAYFINQMMQAIQNVFIGISYLDNVREDESNWVQRLNRITVQIPECHAKLNKLLTYSMEATRLICKNRNNIQLLQVVKLFKSYVEYNDISHIQYDAIAMERKFKTIF